MFDKFMSKTALDALARIGDDAENLSRLSDAELALVLSNQWQSCTAIANAFYRAAGGDGELCAKHIAEVAAMVKVDDDRKHERDVAKLLKRAQRCHDKIANGRPPTLPQWASLLMVGRAEMDNFEAEIARRERGGETLQ